MTSAWSEDAALLAAAQAALAGGQPRKALELLNHSKSESVAVRNAHGVCLLNLGDWQSALDHYRVLVLEKGGLALRNGVPSAVRANYALALLASGSPIGAENLLFEIADEADPAVARVRAMLRRWRTARPWWQRVLLRLGVQMAFEPVRLDDKPVALWMPAGRAETAPADRRPRAA